jgi:uncharacterized protein (DUF302 family)
MKESLAYEVSLQCSCPEAIDKVTTALKAEGFGILTRIDVKETLKQKIGVDFRPYVILGACNPPLAHRALSAQPMAGLLLPCNVTVEERAEGGATVRIGNPDVLLAASGMQEEPALSEVGSEARDRLRRVADALRAS